ncbi:H-type lectin domain-containing protein [Pseudooceanicola spongiae]|uniref:H-type lectin domain-containing protein n=1 Tax=Pseudooceanicola spongiae TaxID=2613965 RepID=A0A7L9WSZ5_9RHOB|nr:H-type lectin domain-containing protein [Pseudooceanicola spongiae]QOL82556.1 hypothetical protein F3W81_18070 [Pseudooceanicola spongiae]
MKKLSTHRIGVEQGDSTLFSDFQDGGEMWTGTGPRERRKRVAFSEAFAQPPSVQCSLSMWDMAQASNQRADISAESVTEKGFEIVFRTWGDTRVARARVAWMAIGELAHEDDWQV